MTKTHKKTSSQSHNRYSGAKDEGNSKYSHHLCIEVSILKAEVFLSPPLSCIIEDLSLLES